MNEAPRPPDSDEADLDARLLALTMRHAEDWLRTAHAIAGDAHYAEDAVAEALAALAEAWRDPRALRDPAAWMAGTVRRRAHARLRDETAHDRHTQHYVREAARSPTSATVASGENIPPGDDVPGGDPPDLRDLAPMLADLPGRQREALTLRFDERLPHARIAQRMDCAESTARNLVRQAFQSLRRIWTNRNDGEPPTNPDD